MIKLILGGLLIVAVGFAAYVRVKPLDEEALHVDPTTAERPDVSGHVLVREDGDITSPVYLVPAAELAKTLKGIIEQTPRTSLLAGDLVEGYATYVTRSKIWGFPDVASVKVVDLGNEMSSVVILSRLTIGSSDMGVNQMRVEGWLKALSGSSKN